MASTTVKVDGLKEISAAIAELGKSTGRNVLRRVAVARLQPMAEEARRLAPDDPKTGGNDLRHSIDVSTKSGGYAARINRFGKSEVEAYMGPAGRGGTKAPPQGSLQEFGTVTNTPQPFMRPAWDGGKDKLLDGIKDDLWDEIKKAADRKAKRAAKLAAKG